MATLLILRTLNVFISQTKGSSYNSVIIFFNLIKMDKLILYLISLFLSLTALPNHPVIFWIFSQILPLLHRRLQQPLQLEPLHGEVEKPCCQRLFLQSPSSCLAELKLVFLCYHRMFPAHSQASADLRVRHPFAAYYYMHNSISCL